MAQLQWSFPCLKECKNSFPSFRNLCCYSNTYPLSFKVAEIPAFALIKERVEFKIVARGQNNSTFQRGYIVARVLFD